jgi:hypothetical protein
MYHLPSFLNPLERDLLAPFIQIWSSPGVFKELNVLNPGCNQKGGGGYPSNFDSQLASTLIILLLHGKPITSPRVYNSSKSLDWTTVGQTAKTNEGGVDKLIQIPSSAGKA